MTQPEAVPAEQFGADFYQDPLAYFARMREERPVTPALLPNGDRAWLVTRYADVRAALADPRLLPSGYSSVPRGDSGQLTISHANIE